MAIYHERQYSNHCALHAINALMQAPVYTFEDLVLIAQSLDEQESTLMERHDDRYESQNMDRSGNFSIQVIIEALAPCGMQLIPFHSTDPIAISARQNTANKQAFLCHQNNHWFILRKLGAEWFDLNSLLPYPQQVNVIGTHLSHFAEPALIQSYTGLFIVVGNVPQRHCLEEPKNNETAKLQALPMEVEEQLFLASELIGKNERNDNQTLEEKQPKRKRYLLVEKKKILKKQRNGCLQSGFQCIRKEILNLKKKLQLVDW